MSQEVQALPTVTFAIATLNEERRLPRCLAAIAAQRYPSDLVEILIADGGSHDGTREIASRFGARVIDNVKRLAEPGLALAYEHARGELVVFMAADNILFDPDWLSKMIEPFGRPDHVGVALAKVVNDPEDNWWNKYLNEDAEPFSMFVYRNASHVDKFRRKYPVETENDHYVVYRFSAFDFPLIALAQCTIVRAGLARSTQSNFDDIQPIIELIEQGHKIAIVKTTGLYHYSMAGFRDFVRKTNRRIYNAMTTKSFALRERLGPRGRTIRKYVFLVYALTLVVPILEGVYLTARRRRPYMIVHPVACVVFAALIIGNAVRTMNGKRRASPVGSRQSVS